MSTNAVNPRSIDLKIRDATAEDCDAISGLIMQLAVYEKMPEKAKLTGSDLRRDGFEAKNPLFYSKVAEIEGKRVVGFVLYFFHYSTWNGKVIHLEDFYVEPEFRGSGIGSALFKSVAQEAVRTNSDYVNFVVLAWNEPSIKFYENRGARNLSDAEEWRMFRLQGDALVRLAKEGDD